MTYNSLKISGIHAFKLSLSFTKLSPEEASPNLSLDAAPGQKSPFRSNLDKLQLHNLNVDQPQFVEA